MAAYTMSSRLFVAVLGERLADVERRALGIRRDPSTELGEHSQRHEPAARIDEMTMSFGRVRMLRAA
jgi:hypothetical protein